MNYYETILIFDGRITEKKYDAGISHYIKKITEFGGLFRTKDRMGKKTLAYAYKRDGAEIEDGWYIVFTYKGHPDMISKLESEFHKDDTILKFLTIKRSDEDLEEYAEVSDDKIEVESPAEIITEATVESEQSSARDAWDLVFNLEEV